MSLKEILTMRIYRFLRDRFVKPGPKVPRDLSLDLRPFPSGEREFYLSHFAHLKKELIQDAEWVMENRIRLFGREFSFPQNIDWNRDFLTGKKWPHKILDYHTSQAGDPRDIWELNRHQFLPVLGEAFGVTKDERYAQKAVFLIDSWIEQNPPYRGINWASAFELALRILSWIWALKFIIGSQALTKKSYQKICESLFRQTHHILKMFSLYSSANNHLIGELTAVASMGLYFHHDRWTKKALALLEEEIDHQLLPDGVGAEQSPYYQAHVMEYYLLVALLLREQGLAVPDKIMKGLQRGSVFLQALLNEDGYPSQIGDNDSGEVLRLACRYSNFKSLLNLAAYVAEEDRLLQGDIGQDEKTFWLIGSGNFQSLFKKAEGKNKTIRYAFPGGGYYVLEKSFPGTELKLIFDCGPLGMKPMAGHGHSDALSFILFVNGHPVFIDPGTYTYFKSDFWRNYFRGTSAHNTIRLDGENQSKFVGKFLALSHAVAKCTEWEEGRKVTGQHDGYVRHKNAAIHTRTISLDDHNSVVQIKDTIETQGSHLIEQFFHVDRDAVLKEVEDRRFEIITPHKNILIRMDQSLEVMIYYGDEAIPLGWQSASFGHKEKNFTLAGRKRIASTTTLITEICV
jgi:uncharacterized heparinase superfamily protein